MPAELSVIFLAAGARFACPAGALREVRGAARGVPMAAGAFLPVEDFSLLIGGRAETDPEAVTLILDASPPRAFRVRGVEEIFRADDAPALELPEIVRLAAHGILRGARHHRGEVVLELIPEALATLPVQRHRPPDDLAWAPVEAQPVDRVLVFRSGGAALLAPLDQVTAVLHGPKISPLPLLPARLEGLFHHQGRVGVAAEASMWLDPNAPPPGPQVPRPSGPLDYLVVLECPGGLLGVGATAVEGIQVMPILLEAGRGGTWMRLGDKRRALLPHYDVALRM